MRLYLKKKKERKEPGIVVHPHNPSYMESVGRRITVIGRSQSEASPRENVQDPI
jgi:hypothetical protein